MNRAQRRAAARTRRPAFDPFAGFDGASFNRLVRSSCTDCGGSDLHWMPLGDLTDHLPADRQDDARDLVGQLAGSDGEAWLCLSCKAYGVLGDWERG